MPIEQTSSEQQFRWWVSFVSTGENKKIASLMLARADNDITSIASGNSELAELSDRPRLS